MSIDPSTLAPDTPVMTERGTVLSANDVSECTTPPVVARVGEWLPTDEQEVPREKWATITTGSRVRIEDREGGVHIVVVTRSNGMVIDSTLNVWHRQNIARVWVLDEPDPDADLIERITREIDKYQGVGDETRIARAMLAVVREDGAR